MKKVMVLMITLCFLDCASAKTIERQTSKKYISYQYNKKYGIIEKITNEAVVEGRKKTYTTIIEDSGIHISDDLKQEFNGGNPIYLTKVIKEGKVVSRTLWCKDSFKRNSYGILIKNDKSWVYQDNTFITYKNPPTPLYPIIVHNFFFFLLSFLINGVLYFMFWNELKNYKKISVLLLYSLISFCFYKACILHLIFNIPVFVGIIVGYLVIRKIMSLK